MRHRKSGVKLNRTTSHRQAMFRNMVTSLLKHDRIKTTEAKAKELRRWADHIVTLAKRGDLHARRMAMAIVREKDVVHKIFEEATDRFGAINGGYTRIIKIGRRAGDAAAMTLVELVSSDDAKPVKKKKKTTKTEAKPAAKVQPVGQDAAAGEDSGEADVADSSGEDATLAADPVATESHPAEPAEGAAGADDDAKGSAESDGTEK
ncbi:hypothetical protein DSCA_21180 [Desulfosarcina alkanivorans]|jgi:large subunit ribosomal protein L17|uniref:Large ribosomal subunit protein bL17 n=1 Tax=Desulfosarcina alkanivorans TaxID=571177 RepID=A0A5K7YGI3_9BACT|nr:hypothetical protein DSCA_21180 [Desulfosarcina alkanivorans]